MKYRVFKKTRNGRKDSTYTARFFGEGMKPVDRGLGITNKEAAQKVAAQKLSDMERTGCGLDELDRIAEERRFSLPDLVAMFDKYKRADKNLSKDYTRHLPRRCLVVFGVTGCTQLEHVTEARLQDFLVSNEAEDMGAMTVRHHMDAVRAFLTYCISRKLVDKTVLEAVPKVKKPRTPQIERLPFTLEELSRLWNVDRFFGPVYVLMAYTGLRPKEMEALRADDILLDVPKPVVRIRIEDAKADRHDDVFLVQDGLEAATFLRQLACSEGRSRILRNKRINLRKFDSHLAAAGIPKHGACGGVHVRYSLRNTLADMLIRSRVHPAVAQRQMRHADISLTMQVYAKAGMSQQFEELCHLPSLDGDRPLMRPLDNGTKGHDAEQRATDSVQKQTARTRSRPVKAETGWDRMNKSVTDAQQKWSRGESNPRAVTVGTTLLRV